MSDVREQRSILQTQVVIDQAWAEVRDKHWSDVRRLAFDGPAMNDSDHDLTKKLASLVLTTLFAKAGGVT